MVFMVRQYILSLSVSTLLCLVLSTAASRAVHASDRLQETIVF